MIVNRTKFVKKLPNLNIFRKNNVDNTRNFNEEIKRRFFFKPTKKPPKKPAFYYFGIMQCFVYYATRYG